MDGKPPLTIEALIQQAQAFAAQEILQNPPLVGCLTISNALKWRLQYARVIEKAGSVEGVIRVL